MCIRDRYTAISLMTSRDITFFMPSVMSFLPNLCSMPVKSRPSFISSSPVSYTHLSALSSGLVPLTYEVATPFLKYVSLFAVTAVPFVILPVAVSYTNLDVYKRQ